MQKPSAKLIHAVTTAMTQTDRRTDRQTDGFLALYNRLASKATPKILQYDDVCSLLHSLLQFSQIKLVHCTFSWPI